MFLKASKLLLLICLIPIFGGAQDCILDIGGKNSKTIIEIFQLNADQKATLESLRGDLAVTTERLEGLIQKVLKEYPQSSEEDLIKLANKYRDLQQELVLAAWESDKKLLELFNSKQYKAYLDLCKAANREPIQITPVTVVDSLGPK